MCAENCAGNWRFGHLQRAEAETPSLSNRCKTINHIKPVEARNVLHTQEVRGSSPCAPTILFHLYTSVLLSSRSFLWALRT